MDEELKREWEQKIRSSYSDGDALVKFMRETMDNFAYRYISSTLTPTPTTHFTSANKVEVQAREESMVQALKIGNPQAKSGIMELAKTVPKAKHPTVQYGIALELQEFKPDLGKIVVRASVNWDFPEHNPKTDKKVELAKTFKWDDLQVFRKGFPLAVQEVCDLFL